MTLPQPIQLLREPAQEPTDSLFQSILDKSSYDFRKYIEQNIADADLLLEWRYYNDGKSWLGKTTYKKKTVVWISLWDKFIKAGFYFTDKTRPGILELAISEKIKTSFSAAQPMGKLIPLIMDIKSIDEMNDFCIIMNHKKNLR